MIRQHFVLTLSLLSCCALAQSVNAEQRVSIFAGTATGQTEFSAPRIPFEFNAPFGIALTSAAHAFVVELEGGRVIGLAGQQAKVIAGTDDKSYSGDGGDPKLASFNGMHNLAIDGHTLYLADTWNHCIRQLDTRSAELVERDGKPRLTTIAGMGEPRFAGDGGPANKARFNHVMCITLNPAKDKLYVADLRNRRIRVLDLTTGIVTTVAGNGEQGVPSDGSVATESPLVDPRAVTADAEGNVFILERGGHALRMVSPGGTIRTVAGTGEKGYHDGAALAAQFNSPKHLCLGRGHDGETSIFIADDVNRAIREFNPWTKSVTTVLGSGHGDASIELSHPHGVCYFESHLYVVDTGNNRILQVAPDASFER